MKIPAKLFGVCGFFDLRDLDICGPVNRLKPKQTKSKRVSKTKVFHLSKTTMTRYARAEGSKADNKREEEAATPWHVMVANIRRSGPPAGRRKDLSAKSRPDNPEDFDESDDIVNQPDSDDERKTKKKKVKDEEDEPEEEYDPSMTTY